MSESESPMEDGAARGVSRRTVAKAMAWSVPVVAVASSVPAYAASGEGPSGVFLAACKQPGESCDSTSKPYGFIKGYTFTLTITNNSTKTVYIYATNNGTPVSGGGVMNPVLDLLSAPLKTFSYNTARRFLGGVIGAALLEGEPVAPNGGSLTIIINAGINENSSNIEAHGGLYVAWGHTAVPGADPDHPYFPVPGAGLPPASQPGPMGPGWFYVPINFGSTPPCGTDCAPGGDETEITGVVPGMPGYFEPLGVLVPADLADLKADQTVGDAAYVSAAWTAGQYVILQDTSNAYWNGSSWQAGIAP